MHDHRSITPGGDADGRPAAGRWSLAAATPALLVAGVLALVAVVTWPLREAVYVTVAPAVATSPVAAAVAGTLAQRGPLLLVALAAVLVVVTVLRDRPAFWTLVAGGAGVIGAYLISAGVKLLVAEQRPCQVWEVSTVLTCPAVGDWSWPSNHSLVAAAFATACMLAVPRTAWLAVPVAVLSGLARLAAGVHYLHDVAAGLALGTAVVVVVVLLLRRVTRSGWPPPSGPAR
ncbi:MAG TPA: phosphatase PAP2 family protein [Ruania sp.]|nr:phosphatase PAP2 family protein [Ruania sp.]